MSAEIEKLIPHRDPFLFVERLEVADETQTVGYRRFTAEKDDFFKGHFPEFQVVPGVLLIEAMAQCGGAGLKKVGLVPEDSLFFLASVDKAKFRRRVVPGDEVRFDIHHARVSGKMIKQQGTAWVGEEKACEASWLAILADKEAL